MFASAARLGSGSCSGFSRLLWLGFAWAGWCSGVQAQSVVADPSLGTRVDAGLAGFNTLNISGGAIEGTHLFHSFDQFSPEAATVLFNLSDPRYGGAANGIERIFSRVTGGEASRINGILAVEGGEQPDLFLLNPNGILFGPGAQLRLGGSFLASSAEAIQFADGSSFAAGLPQAPWASPLLSVSVPVGLQLGQNPGSIRLVGSGHGLVDLNRTGLLINAGDRPGLSVAPGQSLTLVGGEIVLEGGVIQPLATPFVLPLPLENRFLPAGGIQVSLGSFADGTVPFQWGALGLRLGPAQVNQYRDIRLSDRAWIDGSGLLPSDLQLVGQNITLEGGSTLSLQEWGDRNNPGGISLWATGSLDISGSAGKAPNQGMLSESVLNDIVLQNPAINTLDTNINTGIRNLVLGRGKGGDITIVAEQLRLREAAIVNTITSSGFTSNSGDAGDIHIRVAQDFDLIGPSNDPSLPDRPITLLTSSTFGSSGKGGDITIETGNLRIEQGGLLTATTFGSSRVSPSAVPLPSGDSGDIKITARESVEVRGLNPVNPVLSSLTSSSFSAGNAGDIDIQTQRLMVEDNGIVQAASYAQGNSGSVRITATERVRVAGRANNFANLPTQISASALSSNEFARSIFVSQANRPSGNVGSVTVRTAQLELEDEGLISVINEGSGTAGDLEIFSDSILLRRGSSLSASAQREGGGEGGNISIRTGLLIAVPSENSDISANAVNQSGGSIQLQADAVLGIEVRPQSTPRSDITVSSQFGASGTVEFSQPQTDPDVQSVALPDEFEDQSDRLAQSCNPGEGQFSATQQRQPLQNLAMLLSSPEIPPGLTPAEAIATLQKSLTPLDTTPNALGHSAEQALLLGQIGKIYEQTEQWQKAEHYTRQALQQSQLDPFQSYQWQWQLGRIARSRWQASGKAVFRESAIAYYQEALNALRPIRSDLAALEDGMGFSFRRSIEPVYRDLVTLLLEPAAPGSGPQPIPQTALRQSLAAIEALRVAEIDNFFNDACSTVTARAVDGLDPNAAVLYPIVLPDRLEVILSLPDGSLHHHSSPLSAAEVQRLTQEFQAGLVTRSRRNYRKPGQQLYAALIRPFLKNLPPATVKTLVLVPDGPFKNIPIAALWDGQQHLVEQFNVAVAPGLELLDAQPSQAIGTQAITAGLSEYRDGFSALDFVPQELRDVQAFIPGDKLLNESFTKDEFRRSLLQSSAPIVHIATHGQFSSEADETFILAWDDRISAKQLGELLRLREQQQGPTELLVLSACETAAGDETAALGLAGLAVRAGARSTLASLWNINDASTAMMMQAFYRQLAQQSSNKSEALRQAQLAMLQDSKYSHPYYWSAFVLVGNWQ